MLVFLLKVPQKIKVEGNFSVIASGSFFAYNHRPKSRQLSKAPSLTSPYLVS